MAAMTMKKKYRILLSGAGLMGRKHAELIQGHKDCELIAVIGPATEHNQAFSACFGAPLYATIQDVVSHQQVDAAIISSPNEFHFDQAIACINQAIPVLVEKPITHTLDSAKMLAAEADRLEVPVLVGHHRSHSPLLDAAASFMKSEKFGRLVAVQGSALFYKPAHYFVEGPWRSKIGGGPILINLIHEIGVMRQLCGEIIRLVALAGHHLRQFQVEDTVAINLEFENGALGTFLLSDTAASNKSWEMTSGENPAYPYFPEHNCYHFAGTNGSLDFPSLQARYYNSSEAASWWTPFTDIKLDLLRSDPLEQQLSHFIRVIQKLEQPKVSAKDGYLNMVIVDAITRSITTRSVIEIDVTGFNK